MSIQNLADQLESCETVNRWQQVARQTGCLFWPARGQKPEHVIARQAVPAFQVAWRPAKPRDYLPQPLDGGKPGKRLVPLGRGRAARKPHSQAWAVRSRKPQDVINEACDCPGTAPHAQVRRQARCHLRRSRYAAGWVQGALHFACEACLQSPRIRTGWLPVQMCPACSRR